VDAVDGEQSDDYLSKPLDRERLFDLLELWIGRGDASLRSDPEVRSS
jgi:hypothetical protein